MCDFLPPAAAAILSKVDPKIAAQILAKMPERQRSLIIQAFDGDNRGKILKEIAAIGGAMGAGSISAKDLAMLDPEAAADIMNSMSGKDAAKLMEAGRVYSHATHVFSLNLRL